MFNMYNLDLLILIMHAAPYFFLAEHTEVWIFMWGTPDRKGYQQLSNTFAMLTLTVIDKYQEHVSCLLLHVLIS